MGSVKQKILFIINPISGVGKQKTIEKLIESELDHTQFEVSIEYTKTAKHAITISKENALNFSVIIAVGGDGSVNEIARGLINTNTTLGIIPTGSGNGLARHLKIPMNLKKAITLINVGKTKQIDTVNINEEFFFCTAGVGLDGFVSWKFATAKKRGLSSYIKITLRSILKYKPKDYRIEYNGQQKDVSNVIIATFANSNQYGNNVQISPNSVIDDGFVRLIIIQKFPILSFIPFAYYLFSKELPQFKYCEEIVAKDFKIINDNTKLHVDGEPIELDRKLHISANQQSLNVITP